MPVLQNFTDCILCVCWDANFELLSVVVCYFIAEKWWKTFMLESLFSTPNWGFLGDYFSARGDMIMRPPKGASLRKSASSEPLLVFLRRFVRAVRASEKQGTRRLYFTHRPIPRRHRRADWNQNWHFRRSWRHDQSYKILCRSVLLFLIYEGLNFRVFHRNGEWPLPHWLALPRCHVTVNSFPCNNQRTEF
jgi:hypothetical protein